jgi:urease accessory protein UreE
MTYYRIIVDLPPRQVGDRTFSRERGEMSRVALEWAQGREKMGQVFLTPTITLSAGDKVMVKDGMLSVVVVYHFEVTGVEPLCYQKVADATHQLARAIEQAFGVKPDVIVQSF